MSSPEWTFLSNHTHVLHCIYLSPQIRIRDIAAQVEITERAVQRIVVDLERAGYLTRERVGRQNHYRLEQGLRLRHPMEHHVDVARLLAALQPTSSGLRASLAKPRDFAANGVKAVAAPASRNTAKADRRVKKKSGKSPKRAAKKAS